MLRPPGRPGPVARSRGASVSRVSSPRPRAPRRSHYHQYPRCVVGASALGLDAPDALIAALKDDADLTAAPLAKALAEQIARGEPSKCIGVAFDGHPIMGPIGVFGGEVRLARPSFVGPLDVSAGDPVFVAGSRPRLRRGQRRSGRLQRRDGRRRRLALLRDGAPRGRRRRPRVPLCHRRVPVPARGHEFPATPAVQGRALGRPVV